MPVENLTSARIKKKRGGKRKEEEKEKRGKKREKRKRNATLHDGRKRHVEIHSRRSRAFLRKFNENRNWICSLRGITPVAPPRRAGSWILLSPTGKVLSVSAFVASRGFDGQRHRRATTDVQTWIDVVHRMRYCGSVNFADYTFPASAWPTRSHTNWTHNLFRALVRCISYVITE